MQQETTQKALEQLEWLSQDGNMTLNAIGARVGVSRVTVSRWVNGHKRPFPLARAAIAKIYRERRAELGLSD